MLVISIFLAISTIALNLFLQLIQEPVSPLPTESPSFSEWCSPGLVTCCVRAHNEIDSVWLNGSLQEISVIEEGRISSTTFTFEEPRYYGYLAISTKINIDYDGFVSISCSSTRSNSPWNADLEFSFVVSYSGDRLPIGWYLPSYSGFKKSGIRLESFSDECSADSSWYLAGLNSDSSIGSLLEIIDTCSPSLTSSPTSSPTTIPSPSPTTSSPSSSPSKSPSEFSYPSCFECCSAQFPTSSPTNIPSLSPTSSAPTISPSVSPSLGPSLGPSISPTTTPSVSPSISPTTTPSHSPSWGPSLRPSISPITRFPSISPTLYPSFSPTEPDATLAPTTLEPTNLPSSSPTLSPSLSPSVHPSSSPTRAPSFSPTSLPSSSPTSLPSISPSVRPTISPSKSPSVRPTSSPSALPSISPSSSPTFRPSLGPSTTIPSASPTEACVPGTVTCCISLENNFEQIWVNDVDITGSVTIEASTGQRQELSVSFSEPSSFSQISIKGSQDKPNGENMALTCTCTRPESLWDGLTSNPDVYDWKRVSSVGDNLPTNWYFYSFSAGLDLGGFSGSSPLTGSCSSSLAGDSITTGGANGNFFGFYLKINQICN